MKEAGVKEEGMYPLKQIFKYWVIAASVVAGVDSYNGVRCTQTAGVYDFTPPQNASPVLRDIWRLALGVPYGAGRGALHNTATSITGGGRCGSNSHTTALRQGLDRNFMQGLGNGFAITQIVVGLPGAMIGGIGAEWSVVLSGASYRP